MNGKLAEIANYMVQKLGCTHTEQQTEQSSIGGRTKLELHNTAGSMVLLHDTWCRRLCNREENECSATFATAGRTGFYGRTQLLGIAVCTAEGLMSCAQKKCLN